MPENRPRLLLAEDDPRLGPIMAKVLDEVYEVTSYRTATKHSR
jgi:two-component system response regulator QseB